MGVYIEGMEMPTSCYMCDFCADFVQEDGIETLGCRRLKRAVPLRAGFKFDDCPLVPVPPHGDLIDRDALPWEKQSLMEADEGWALPCVLIEDAPTIIPASEEGK